MFLLHDFINGEFVQCPDDDRTLSKFVGVNPATLDELYVINSSVRNVNLAVEGARAAFPEWSKTPAVKRAAILNEIARLLESKIDEFAQAESQNQGKPVSVARSVDIPRAVWNFRFFASFILHQQTQCTQQHEFSALNYTLKQPVGVAGLIAPWNLPLYLLSWKIAPCIAFGNTCVAKPSEFTSLTAFMLCRDVLNQAGLPRGVVNMCFGAGDIGQAIVQSEHVNLVSFTGSTAIGMKIQSLCAGDSSGRIKKTSLEMGGKNAAIIFADCDMEKAVETTLRSGFANSGQVCLCTSRVFVQKSIFNEFGERLVEKVKQELVLGDPACDKTRLGPVVSRPHYDKVTSFLRGLTTRDSFLDDNRTLGDCATIVCGGDPDNETNWRERDLPEALRKGHYIRPTVIVDVNES